LFKARPGARSLVNIGCCVKRINGTLKTKTLSISLICIATWAFAAVVARAEGKLLGDESDGGRAHPTHLIPLFYQADDGKKSNEQIKPGDDPLLPFSTKHTCGSCHSYDIINKGWHFNYVDPNVGCGRPGEPWILFDAKTGTQIPISHRAWAGTFKPEQVGLTARQFTLLFGRQTPGGGAGEIDSTEPGDISREAVSGKLEINCLSCHNGHYSQDQGGPSGYAVQIVRENFRWAAAASGGIASVTGSAKDMPSTYDPFFPEPPAGKTPPTVTYRKDAFDQENRVSFNIVREVRNQRCYFCHSNVYYESGGKEKWSADEDIHLTAGLKCVDCHRNGLNHNIIRGYPGEPPDPNNRQVVRTSTCEGCHLGADQPDRPLGGRLGAPVPMHKGIPPAHFKKLTCTACHSGPWPGEKTVLAKTSRSHRLGTPNVNKAEEMLPHIVAPVLVKGSDGKIAPHKVVWPAYWGTLQDQNVAPIAYATVEKVVGAVFAGLEFPASGDWPRLTIENIKAALKALASDRSLGGSVVYVSAGKVFRLDDSGGVAVEADHRAAAPYLWPIGHNVRPAAQSLGARQCEDCHSPTAPFFSGEVRIDSALDSEAGVFKRMIDLYEADGPVYVRVNWFFRLLIVGIMSLLILHIVGDLFRRVMSRLSKQAK
jgi:hypothetical protein